MGFLTELVGAVVDAVEEATGNEHSEAGDWVEEQAAAVEEAAASAGEAAEQGASDAAGFLGDVVEGAEDGADSMAGWVIDGLGDAGVSVPSRLDLASIVTLVLDIGEVTAARVEEKVVRIVGARPVHAVKTVVGSLQDGPAGAWELAKGIIVETVDADGRIRQWGSKTGSVLANTPPSEVLEQVMRSAPGGPAAILDAIRTILRGGKRGQQGNRECGIEGCARRAEEERRRVLAEVRWAQQLILAAAESPAGRRTARSVRLARYSRTPEGLELRRLTRGLLSAEVQSAEAVRHLRVATAAAVRSALLHAEMQVWLALIRRLAARIPVIAAARGQAVPGRPAPGGVRAIR